MNRNHERHSPRPLTVGLIVALALLLLLSLPLASSGMLHVEIDEAGGSRKDFRIPGALVSIVVHLIPDRVFDEVRSDMGEEAERWWPAVEEACRHLRDCPDARLVDVESRHEQVNVFKRGRNLVVEVESDRDHVRVAVPVKVVGTVVRKLDPRR